jgi:hypothetical protein
LAAAILNLAAAMSKFNVVPNRTLLIALAFSCQTQKIAILYLEWRRCLGTIKSCNYCRFPIRHLNYQLRYSQSQYTTEVSFGYATRDWKLHEKFLAVPKILGGAFGNPIRH